MIAWRCAASKAIIQSAESSNRIEGVTVAANRLRPLVLGRAKPRDRSEEEVTGYRAALRWIFSRKPGVAMTPDVIRRLHRLAQGGTTGGAGLWKAHDNEIIEILPSGERCVRFVPVSARQTPAAIDGLCRQFRNASDDERIPALLLVATFVFDFLCIHPFRDGNGRVSRLATTLLLEADGFKVARYISLERLIEETKEEYYRVLKLCSQGWHAGENDIVPWWNYVLGVLRNAYKEFEQRVESVEARHAKSDQVRQIALELKSAGQVRLAGRGRGARWEVVH